MKYDIAMEWAAALRSGKYKQGRNRLNRGGSFCCLGVLCDLSKLGTWNNAHEPDEGSYYKSGKTTAENDVLPKSVMEWADMHSEAGDVPIVASPIAGTYSTLADANDHGVSFEVIADYIEVNWETL